ncbi:DUF433 domain-containing protein [Nostoc piscinale]|uniref:DUF433 domain-containing protein n=1 Tax=Nostoc piscinale TaxID=224012 RepID=UPI002110BD82|nr:DUF433 domain-containing protein [Nostoc piscinale]
MYLPTVFYYPAKTVYLYSGENIILLSFDCITSNSSIPGREACIRGILLPVSLILNLVANNKTVAVIIEDCSYW